MTTTNPDTAEQVRYLSPPEYIKAANARDARVKHSVDLHHFITYLQSAAGLLREMPDTKIDVLIDEYLTETDA
jgi:hypothetical protein